MIRIIKRAYLRRLRTVQFEKQKPASMGSVFTMTGVPRPIDPTALRDLPAPASLQMHPGGPDAALAGLLDGAADDDQIEVVDLVGAALVLSDAFRQTPGGSASVKAYRAHADPLLGVRPYRAIESKRRLTGQVRPAVFPTWPRRQARHGPGDDVGADAERHVSVGVWRVDGDRPQERRPDERWVAPWVVLDFDRGEDREAALEAAQRAVRDLVRLGVRPDDLLCCPTGGRGVHVHIPCGALGTPLYRDAGAARSAMRRFVQATIDEEVDEAVLSPVHLVRAIGSGYYVAPAPSAPSSHAVAAPSSFKVRVPTQKFLEMRVYEMVARSETSEPSALPDPRRARPVPALAAEAVRASYRPERSAPSRGKGKTDAVREVEGGVGAGQRNAAAFVMAAFLLDQLALPEKEALGALLAWNLKNDPPLGEEELGGVLSKAVVAVNEKSRG